MTAPVMNTLDYLKGTKPALSLSPYVTAGGAGTFTPIGTLSEMEVAYDGTIKPVEADTSLFELDQFYTKIAIGLKGTLHEADQRKLAIFMGQFAGTMAAPTNPAIVNRVAGTTDGTATLLVGEPPAVAYYQMQLVLDDQSFQSDPAGHPLNIFTKRTFTFWRVMCVPKIAVQAKRDDWVKVKFEMKPLYDSSVATADKVFKVVDFVAK